MSGNHSPQLRRLGDVAADSFATMQTVSFWRLVVLQACADPAVRCWLTCPLFINGLSHSGERLVPVLAIS